jgi:hypothetical protein
MMNRVRVSSVGLFDMGLLVRLMMNTRRREKLMRGMGWGTSASESGKKREYLQSTLTTEYTPCMDWKVVKKEVKNTWNGGYILGLPSCWNQS